MIRPAHEADLPGILTIYNDVIMSSRAIETDHPCRWRSDKFG